MTSFLLTPPRGGRHEQAVNQPSPALDFYSRPREGGDQVYPAALIVYAYFYSRPREGGDTMDYDEREKRVFLLTPPRGGRLDDCASAMHLFISTHAPARGATLVSRYRRRAKRHFYSRPREGGDVSPRMSFLLSVISTHAPARGATFSMVMVA